MNNILIFNGKTNEIRGEYEISGLPKVERDLTNTKYTEINVWDDNHTNHNNNNNSNNISAYDTCYFNYIIPMVGVIEKVELGDEKDPKTKLKIRIGADSWRDKEYIPDNTISNFNLTQNNNGQNLVVNCQSVAAVTTNNELLKFDTLCRQAMRRTPKREFMAISGNNLTVTINDYTQPEVLPFVRVDDPDLISIKGSFPSDKYNVLRLRNQEDKSLFEDYYLKSDGTVTQDPNDQQLPRVLGEEEVEALNYNDLDFATSRIKQQEYNNTLEFTIPLNTSIVPLQLNDTTLGRKLVLIGIDGTEIETIIAYYKINDGLSITYKMGLTRTKLSDKIGGDL